LFKDLSAFVVGWHIPRRNFNAKEMRLPIINKMNIVANEDEIEVEQRIIIYTPTFEGKL